MNIDTILLWHCSKNGTIKSNELMPLTNRQPSNAGGFRELSSAEPASENRTHFPAPQPAPGITATCQTVLNKKAKKEGENRSCGKKRPSRVQTPKVKCELF